MFSIYVIFCFSIFSHVDICFYFVIGLPQLLRRSVETQRELCGAADHRAATDVRWLCVKGGGEMRGNS